MKWLALIVALLVSPANADEIDYFCIFSNAASAQADGPVGTFWNSVSATWDTSTTFPAVSVVTPQALVNGISSLTGFWIIVSRTADSPALDADTNCVMTLDRDLGKVNGNFVLAAAITGSNRTSLTFHPVPHGSGYPSPLGK
jgi:hypothetical protein